MQNQVVEQVGSGAISNVLYDRLKWIAQYGLPALGTLYFALSSIWGIPNGEEVVGTITAIDAFLGVLVGVSAKAYDKGGSRYDGALVVDTTNPSKDVYSLELATPLDDIGNKNEIILKIQNGS